MSSLNPPSVGASVSGSSRRHSIDTICHPAAERCWIIPELNGPEITSRTRSKYAIAEPPHRGVTSEIRAFHLPNYRTRRVGQVLDLPGNRLEIAIRATSPSARFRDSLFTCGQKARHAQWHGVAESMKCVGKGQNEDQVQQNEAWRPQRPPCGPCLGIGGGMLADRER